METKWLDYITYLAQQDWFAGMERLVLAFGGRVPKPILKEYNEDWQKKWS